MSEEGDRVIRLKTPVCDEVLAEVEAGDRVEISGVIYAARDAVLPKLARMAKEGCLEELPVSLKGAAIMHTAVSPAGFGPTSSNKEEIEGTMLILSEVGVRVHIGKGALKPETVTGLSRAGSVYVVTPPVTALFQRNLVSKRMVAFEEEGMEALHELVIRRLPGVVAAAKGKSVFRRGNRRCPSSSLR